MQQPFDRAAEDLGNSIHFEHVNVTVPDQRLATLFYVAGLGLTRDPYLMVSDTNMWINVGRSQFHLPTGKAQVVRGHTGLVIEGRDALLSRLAAVKGKLDGTKFGFSEHNDHVEAICPWGNRMRVYEPDAQRFGRIALGIPYVEFDVPVGTAKRIADFYPAVFGTPASVQNGDGTVARTLMEHEAAAPLSVWYYFKSETRFVKGKQLPSTTLALDPDRLREELLRYRVVIVEGNESATPGFGQGFVEAALRAFGEEPVASVPPDLWQRLEARARAALRPAQSRRHFDELATRRRASSSANWR